jgi:drug/metabolite transporter (DMT)-like permease
MVKGRIKNNNNGEAAKAIVKTDDEDSLATFLVAAFLYVGTGILQPIVIDYLKSNGSLGRKILVLPTLANVMGMACCGVMVESKEWKSLYKHSRLILTAAAIDWISGMLLTGGILLTGGSIFVIFYNSCPVWTALLSYFVMKQSLTVPQTAGIVLVSCGLIYNVLGNRSTASSKVSDVQGNARIVMIGSVIVLMGSFMHSCMFVVSELALKNKSPPKKKNGTNNKKENANAKDDIDSTDISPPLWSSSLGILESFAMMTWVMINVYLGGFFDPQLGIENPTAPVILKGFVALLCIDAIHAAAFFALLSKLGAVASALLKGVQTIIVVLLSAALFCDPETSPQQCLDTVKISSMSIVLLGVLCFAGSKKKKDNDKEKVIKKSRPLKAKSSPPTSETESLLDK